MAPDFDAAADLSRKCSESAGSLGSPLHCLKNSRKQPYCALFTYSQLQEMMAAENDLHDICPFISKHFTVIDDIISDELNAKKDDERYGCNWPFSIKDATI